MLQSPGFFQHSILAAVLLSVGLPALAASSGDVRPGAAALASTPRASTASSVSGAAGSGPRLDPENSSAADFFGQQRLHVFELTITSADFARMYPPNGGGGRGFGRFDGGGGADNGSGYPKVPAELRFDGQDLGQISIRYKGNSSFRSARTELKRSLKLEFQHGDQHQRFFGMREINLNNNAMDGSQMRETLAYDVFHQAGVPAPRTAFARVYITVPGQHQHEYAGLFTVVEQIDEEFFQERWGHKVGVLVKPEGLSGLPDLGKDWKSYEKAYTSKVPVRKDAPQHLIDFVQFLDHASDSDFASHLDDYLDMDEFLRFLAVETVIVNSDSPLAMNHNYYLTVHPESGKVEWIPWDMNMAFGGFRRSEINLSIFQPSAPGAFPLADRVLASPALKQRYRRVLEEVIGNDMTRARMLGQMRRLLTEVHAAALQDPAGSPAQFEQNFVARPATSGPAGTRVDQFEDDDFGGFGMRGRGGPPLRAFIEQRIDSVRGQLDGTRQGEPGQEGFGFGR